MRVAISRLVGRNSRKDLQKRPLRRPSPRGDLDSAGNQVLHQTCQHRCTIISIFCGSHLTLRQCNGGQTSKAGL
ncbi:hypothetical protein TNCV_3842581 [Trichonephila clavipes]|nr:hypothetical protein TNCV_3842581 [Trichonephila clavipes]